MKKTEFPYQQIVGPDIIWLMISKTEILFTTEFFLRKTYYQYPEKYC